MVGSVRPSVKEDCKQLGPNLRDADKLELHYSNGWGPVQALTNAYTDSVKTYTGCDEEGTPILMFGVVDAGGGVGIPWMLASEGMYAHARQLKTECKQWLEELHENFDVLFNFVHAENTKAIRWLQWIGFQMIRLDPYFGTGRQPFYEFVKVKPHV